MARRIKTAVGACLLLLNVAAAEPMDADNPTCPKFLNWSTYPEMKFTLETINGLRVLKAEGQIDQDVAARLQDALKADNPQEIWLRSPGGDARAGNAAGKIIRAAGIPTRIPAGWACFSACNFVFMGGAIRFVDQGGFFVVHMFTHLGDKEAVRSELKDSDKAIGLIGDVEQDSALLASEDNDFLIRMGVSRKLLTEVMYQQKAVAAGQGDKSTRRCLTQAEAIKYNVANAQ
ncbi:MAG TPA: hypothetical protein VGM04_02815 [Sphingomicrobium sp.]|jgi:hypothetical protein